MPVYKVYAIERDIERLSPTRYGHLGEDPEEMQVPVGYFEGGAMNREQKTEKEYMEYVVNRRKFWYGMYYPEVELPYYDSPYQLGIDPLGFITREPINGILEYSVEEVNRENLSGDSWVVTWFSKWLFKFNYGPGSGNFGIVHESGHGVGYLRFGAFYSADEEWDWRLFYERARHVPLILKGGLPYDVEIEVSPFDPKEWDIEI